MFKLLKLSWEGTESDEGTSFYWLFYQGKEGCLRQA